MKHLIILFSVITFHNLCFSKEPVATYLVGSEINGKTYFLNSDHYIMVTRMDFGTAFSYTGVNGWVSLNRVAFLGSFEILEYHENVIDRGGLNPSYLVSNDISIKPSPNAKWYSMSPWGLEILGPAVNLSFMCAKGSKIEIKIYSKS